MKEGVFKLVDGLRPVDPALLEEYGRAMDEGVRDIVGDARRRRALADEARGRRMSPADEDAP